MVLCIIALPIFAILGLFSATHRELAKEAFRCVFLKLTFKPCDTRLDTRIKATIVGSLLKKNKSLGVFVHKHFTLFSWLFVLLMIASTYYVIDGGINYYKYGNCNGPNSSGFCVFDPLSQNSQFSTLTHEECLIEPPSEKTINVRAFNASLFAYKETDSNVSTLTFIACYSCKYSREVYPVIQDLLNSKKINLVFAHIPLTKEEYLSAAYTNCVYEQNPEVFWSFVNTLFTMTINMSDEKTLSELSGVNISQCKTANESYINTQVQNLVSVGVYGTPTIIVGDQVAVGPKPERVYTRMLKK